MFYKKIDWLLIVIVVCFLLAMVTGCVKSEEELNRNLVSAKKSGVTHLGLVSESGEVFLLDSRSTGSPIGCTLATDDETLSIDDKYFKGNLDKIYEILSTYYSRRRKYMCQTVPFKGYLVIDPLELNKIFNKLNECQEVE